MNSRSTFSDFQFLYQTQQTKQTELYALRILILRAKQYPILLRSDAHTMEDMSSITTTELILLFKMDTQSTHSVESVKWKFMVKNNKFYI